ncbi:unnamed protein product [Echinostoma caproni]|uniref:Thiolase_N domain-containing protein n=1 Tax=Echinostoma caproni TaxID=27848 RepID=A0A183B8W8_9TREM|nr:unnamed protein product [Echinostoma caproni]
MVFRKNADSNNLSPIEVEWTVPSSEKKGANLIVITKDEFPRSDTTIEALARLKPAFCDDAGHGTVTAGNASGVNDGAAFVLLCRSDQLTHLGSRKPLARIVGWHQVGLEPELMGLGPVQAIRGLLEKIHWSVESVDVFEVNEAFAAQSIAVSPRHSSHYKVQ